ncbi:septal ring lytic transglycosylase RlpA family protein [Sandaracinobacter sp. RS1-74]|uniref:septal ring lytic transglycosylase RlpA family protein n=1 Tax=Sandaracinobacteroides sayramensis TaxID=2913411 RepID=UPI001EDACCC2|nr:SPOR domain-containing protein [Sandaracinobacteroides sayramensis]MCG2842608.1 septal ring lytic transglycosylase RlpA family protein [Sandaracinobacteroides sayramensis]
MRSSPLSAELPRPGRLLALGLGLLLAACASQPKPQVAAPKPPAKPSQPSVPGVKIGTPYEVFGVRYFPEDDRNYDREGVASWYGPTFHAKPTANGEIYNQEDVTAAHKTLPMPSWVEVTNLDNGRKLTVRINDRGPFVGERIIDLSKRSAEILGVDRPGLARVRVKRVFPEGDWARAEPPRQSAVQVASAAPVAPPPPSDFVAAPVPVAPSPIPVALPPGAIADPAARFIQVAALSDEGRARALASVLTDFGPAAAHPAPGGLWRVRIGPLQEAQAGNVLFDVQAAGYREARLVR